MVYEKKINIKAVFTILKVSVILTENVASVRQNLLKFVFIAIHSVLIVTLLFIFPLFFCGLFGFGKNNAIIYNF